MPDKKGRFTPQERTTIAAATGIPVKAVARVAGYSQPSAASRAMGRPAVAAEIARINQERLFNEVLPLAVQVHIDLLTNKATPAGARVQAVKLAYDRTLGLQDGPDSKPLEQMTVEELTEAIRRFDQRAEEIAKGAKAVDATIVQEPDILG